MGTRSTTKIYEQYGKEKPSLILSLYKQFDGYPEGWGQDLIDFIESGTFVNGISFTEDRKVFNGIGCFALQLVKEFKKSAGSLYATNAEDEQEYNYKIIYKIHDNEKATLTLTCEENKKFKKEWSYNL